MTIGLGYSEGDYGISPYGKTITFHSSDLDIKEIQLYGYDVGEYGIMPYDDAYYVWYTYWFGEKKILDGMNTLSAISRSDGPCTTHMRCQYDFDGNNKPDGESEEIVLSGDGTVQTIDNIPVKDEGQYRVKLWNYYGDDCFDQINIGFTH